MTAATTRRAGIIIASTRAASGGYADRSAPIIGDWLEGHGFELAEPVIVPDGEPVGAALRDLLAATPSLVITSGGTGLAPDDLTPEMTAPLLDREIPGIMEAIRAVGRTKTPHAALSRGHAGTVGKTLVLNLPGSPSGVRDALGVLDPLITHLCEQIEGGHGHA